MWAFERRFIAKEDISAGPIPARFCTIIWLTLTIILWGSLYFTALNSTNLALYAYMAPFLARLISVDLCYLVLPDIYTLPLIILGLTSTYYLGASITILQSFFGVLVGAGSLLFLFYLFEKCNKKASLGGGDMKMTAAAGAFLGVELLPIFLWISCVLVFILYPFLKKKRCYISFGPALITSFWGLLIHPHIVDKVINFII